MKQLFVILIFLLSALLIFSCASKREEAGGEREKDSDRVSDLPTAVNVMTLENSVFYHDLIANGIISSARIADLRFQTSEIIQHIYVKNGDKVAKGQKIAELDRFKLQNSLLQAKDNLERAALELQDVLIGQGYVLRDSAAIPAEVMSIAKIKSNYGQSLINCQNAEYQYDNAVLYAPFDGVIANLFIKENNMGNASETFCSVIDNSATEAVFYILESEIMLVRQGNLALVSPYAISNFSVEGKVSEINPIVDKNGMVRVKATLKNTGGMPDGMNVKVLIRQQLDRQLVIPKTALVLRTNKKVVFTVKNGIACWNYVSTGPENSTGYVVTEGLQAGDSVIYDGNINLAHESPISITR
jgi:RND family efflux transporter MFP subunit